MSKLRVGVLRGGPSTEYEVSLKTGASMLKNLPKEFKPVDILISKDGQWHIGGIETTPDNALKHIDVALIGMHGNYGEDGQVQRLLHDHGVKFSGSGAFASSLAMNKHLAQEAFERAGLKTPRRVVIDRDGDIEEFARSVYRKIGPPWIVKPSFGGSSVGMNIAKTMQELSYAIEKALFHSQKILVEEFLKGREATVGVVDNFRGAKRYVLPPVQIIHPKSSKFFDYDAKYSGESQEICPGLFTKSEKAELERLAAIAHDALQMNHYSRTDFILSKRGIFVLETNSLPGMTEQSLLPKSLAAVGCSLPDFLRHLVDLAIKENR